MGEGWKAFWLGIFIVVAVAVTAWLILFLRPGVGNCGKILKVRFSNIQSVTVGTRVTFGGKPVGEVKRIDFITDARTEPPDGAGNFYFYELDLCVDSSVAVYNYDEIVFSTSGLMGEKTISILPKATPHGMPPAHEITNEILYARSTDDLQETLTKLMDVAQIFEKAMTHLNEFLDENLDSFHQTIVAVGDAATSINQFVQQVADEDLIVKASQAADHISTTMVSMDLTLQEFRDSGVLDVFGRLSRGEGTLGRLLTSDHFYLQLTAVMCKLETVLSDINHYGLLFQFNRKWQYKRFCKEKAMQQMCTPDEAVRFFNEQMVDICDNLDRLQRLSCRLENPCFDAGFRELMGRVEGLLLNLKRYREMLYDEYCEVCH